MRNFFEGTAKKSLRLIRLVKMLALGGATLLLAVASVAWPQPTAEAFLLAQPSPRPTIDLTATALAQPTSPPGPTNTPLPPGSTNPPQPTGGQPSATATRIRPQATATQTPTAEPPTATASPTSTATTAPPTDVPPTQTPWVILITTTPQPGGGGVIIITVIPTLAATAVQPETSPPPKTNWDWLGWLVIVLVLVLLAMPLVWLVRRKFILPALYPARGRPRSTGVRPGRRRERRLP